MFDQIHRDATRSEAAENQQRSPAAPKRRWPAATLHPANLSIHLLPGYYARSTSSSPPLPAVSATSFTSF